MSRTEGRKERYRILEKCLEPGELKDIRAIAKELECKQDDMLDAICLAVAAKMKAEGVCDTIPGGNVENRDSKGLVMQMVVPKWQLG